jgi:hypothetical protein
VHCKCGNNFAAALEVLLAGGLKEGEGELEPTHYATHVEHDSEEASDESYDSYESEQYSSSYESEDASKVASSSSSSTAIPTPTAAAATTTGGAELKDFEYPDELVMLRALLPENDADQLKAALAVTQVRRMALLHVRSLAVS